MKLTRHNGRSGRKGTYNPKHNDRRFDVNNSEHIDESDGWANVYWDCYQGFHYGYEKEAAAADFLSFEDVERVFYFERYDKYCEAQHERNRSRGHPERDRSTEDLRTDKKTCPEETIIQIGTMETSIGRKYLKEIAVEYFEEFTRRFGEHVHILNWSLHVDEATPHIHERHVFDCENRYGEIAPQQEKALEALGIPLPYPERKPGRNNNRKMKFDSICRVMLFDIAKKHGFDLDENPEYGGRDYLEKQDYIALKQRKVLAEQKRSIEENDQKLKTIQNQIEQEKSKLQELQMRSLDEEAFLEETSQAAYESAVRAVTEKVVEETHNIDFDKIDRFRERVLTDMPHSSGIRKLVYDTLGTLMEEFKGLTRHISERIRQILETPEARAAAQKKVQYDLLSHIRERRGRSR